MARVSAVVLALMTLSCGASSHPASASEDWPRECAAAETFHAEDVAPPDQTQPAVLALVSDGLPFDDTGRERFFHEVARVLASDATLPPLIGRDEMRDAERLVAESRMSEGGVVCRRPPSIVSVLRRAHPHLMVARVYRWDGCDEDAPCGISVFFVAAGLPIAEGRAPEERPHMHATLEGDRADVGVWLDAVRRLARDPEPSAFESLYGCGRGNLRPFSVLDTADDDPALRIVSNLRDVAGPLSECAPRGTMVSVDVEVTIDGSGVGSRAIVRSRQDDAQVAECMREVIERQEWPCTSSGEDERVSLVLCATGRMGASERGSR